MRDAIVPLLIVILALCFIVAIDQFEINQLRAESIACILRR